MQTDFLIIGQGLAGSLLAWELLQRGCHVTVIDNGKENASLVAAGIVNPITGIRFVKTADLETLLPAALDYYAQLSAFFGQKFYLNKPLFRVFRDQNELAYCKKRQKQGGYAPYLGELTLTDQNIEQFLTPFGFIEQLQAGHLLTVPLLSCLKKFFIEHNSYQKTTVDHQIIQTNSDVCWQNITAKQIIFCEGHHASKNHWFSWLPMQPAKGEILTLAHESTLPNAILNYGNWLLPSGFGKVRIGATFDRENLDALPSKQGKETLLKALMPYCPGLAASPIVAHQAGIRPCTADKYPFIGKHPNNGRIAIFNGFGAKGSLQIPWYSQRFADYLLNHQPLPASCDIQRYQATCFPC